MNVTPSDQRRAQVASRFLVSVLVGLFLLGLLGFAVAVLDAGARTDDVAPPSVPAIPDAGAEDRPEGVLVAAADPMVAATSTTGVPATPFDAAHGTSAAVASPPPAGPSDPGAELPASPAPAPSPASSGGASSEAVLVEQPMPVVPVVRFWSTQEGISRGEIERGLASGKLAGHRRLIVQDDIAEALEASLGAAVHPDVARGDMRDVRRAVARGGLGLVAASELVPALRPLRIDGRDLVGNDRVARTKGWPLVVDLPLPEGAGWDQASTWVLVAGGDSFTDRGVYDTVVRKGRGVSFPFDGGTARVTGHGCCDPVYNDNIVPRYRLTGNKGLVRRLFREAELAVVNHEMPTTPAWRFHTSGFTFSGRPDLTRMFADAGIDWVSLANNHIRDFGADGIAQTRRILRRYGLAFGGAGRDLAQAREVNEIVIRGSAGIRVAIVPCVAVAQGIWAGKGVAGATPCKDGYVVPDIKGARRRGADVVIVFPHWGVEYTREPLPSMRKHAARWRKAGADLILGSHSHVAGAIEEIDGAPVLYSLGNLIFDQHWSTNTMESALVEATFHGDRLLSLELHPYIIHATSQPNLLDPASGEGRRLLKAMRTASAEWLDW